MITDFISMRFQYCAAEQDVVLSFHGACFLDHSPCMAIPASPLFIGDLFSVFSELSRPIPAKPVRVLRSVCRRLHSALCRIAVFVQRFKAGGARRL